LPPVSTSGSFGTRQWRWLRWTTQKVRQRGEDIVPDENDVSPSTTDPVQQPQTERTEAANGYIPSTGDPASTDDAADGTFPRVDGEPLSTVAASNTAPDASAIRADVLAQATLYIELDLP
jgi:hypothetical protein